jgi:hypothetical protein
MTLSIIIPNIKSDMDMSKYLHVSLTTLNNQCAVEWKDNVEVIVINKMGESVDTSKYPDIKDYIIQFNTSKSYTKSLKDAMELSNGKYLTFIEPHCSIKNTSSLERILSYLTDDPYENVCFNVNSELSTTYKEVNRSTLGVVLCKQWLIDKEVRLDTNEFINPLYYLSAAVDCAQDRALYVQDEEFMYLTDDFIEVTDALLNEIAGIESFVLIKKYNNTKQKFISDIIESCYLAATPLLDAPILSEPKIRAKMIATLNKLAPISIHDVKAMDNISVPGDVTGADSARLNRFLSGVFGGIK